MAQSPSSSTRSTLENALQEFRQRLHAKVPLELKCLSDFQEEMRIREDAELMKIPVVNDLMKDHHHEADTDRTAATLIYQFSKMAQEVIEECVKAHQNYREAFFKKRIKEQSDQFKIALEARILRRHRDCDMASFNQYAENCKTLALSYFDIWGYDDNHGSFFMEQKEKLKKELDVLEKQILEDRQTVTTTTTTTGTPSASQSGAQAIPVPNLDAMAMDEDQTRSEDEHQNNLIKNAAPKQQNSSGLGGKAVKIGPAWKPVIPLTRHDPPTTSCTVNRQPLTLATNIFGRGHDPQSSPNTDKSMVTTTTQGKSPLQSTTEDVVIVRGGGGLRRRHLFPEEAGGRPGTSIGLDGGPCFTLPKRPKLAAPPPTVFGNENHPLVFFLSEDNIMMGLLVADNFRNIYHPKQGESPVVGINENQQLVCGTNALKCSARWTLVDMLRENVPPGRKISFKIHQDFIQKELHLPFFLGLIMRTMKEYAESKLEKSFRSSIVVTPIWMSSSRRLEFKDAANIAGFSEVTIVNLESLAVFAYYSRLMNSWREPNKEVILVLCVSMGVLSAIVYQYDSNLKRVIMVDDQLIRIPNQMGDLETRRKNVIELLSCLSLDKHANFGKEKKVMSLTECPEWRETFRGVAETIGYGFEDVSSLLELLGGVNLKEMQAIVGEYQPFKLRPFRDGMNNNYAQLVYEHMSKVLLKKDICHEVGLTVFQTFGKLRLYQADILQGKIVTLGELEFKGNQEIVRGSTNLLLTFQVSAEFIISLESVKLKRSEKVKSLPTEDYKWTPMTLSDGERNDLRQLVYDILQAKQFPMPQVLVKNE